MILQAIVISTGSLLSGAAIIRLARGRLLTFRYTVGWLGLLLTSAFSGLFIGAAQPLARSLGVTPGVIAFGLIAIVLITICVQLSISISGLQRQLRLLNERFVIDNLEKPQQVDIQRDVLAVVPAFNEEATVGSVVEELRSFGFDVVVVDDGSTDRTASLAEAAGATVIILPYNAGVGGALRVAFKYARKYDYKVVIQCDADGQHPVAVAPKLIRALQSEGLDLVIGSRFIDTDPGTMRISLIRKVAMRMLASSARRACGSTITDSTSGFRAIDRRLVAALADHLPSYYLGDTFEAIVGAGRAGYKIGEIPATIKDRAHGTSSATPAKAAKLAVRTFVTALTRLNMKLPPKDSVAS